MIKTAKELAAACLDVAKNYKTLYVMGCFGWPMNDYNKQRAIREHTYNRNRAGKINALSADTFGFDCVNLIKALLWGWVGDVTAPYGGAVYSANGVPDINDDMMIAACNAVSTDFSKIAVGEVVWMPGHIGVYVGDGLVVECTPIWGDGVQITACNCDKAGYNRRDWVKHGKLPYVTYEAEPEKPAEEKNVDYTLGMRYLSNGCKGEDVCALQILLIGRGYSCGKWGADGDFGAGTEKAVKAFQNDCEIEVDGVVGKDTMSRLLGVTA